MPTKRPPAAGTVTLIERVRRVRRGIRSRSQRRAAKSKSSSIAWKRPSTSGFARGWVSTWKRFARIARITIGPTSSAGIVCAASALAAAAAPPIAASCGAACSPNASGRFSADVPVRFDATTPGHSTETPMPALASSARSISL